MSVDTDPQLRLKAKLDELENIVRTRLEPRVGAQQKGWSEQAPPRDTRVLEAPREAISAFRALLTRFFGGRA